MIIDSTEVAQGGRVATAARRSRPARPGRRRPASMRSTAPAASAGNGPIPGQPLPGFLGADRSAIGCLPKQTPADSRRRRWHHRQDRRRRPGGRRPVRPASGPRTRPRNACKAARSTAGPEVARSAGRLTLADAPPRLSATGVQRTSQSCLVPPTRTPRAPWPRGPSNDRHGRRVRCPDPSACSSSQACRTRREVRQAGNTGLTVQTRQPRCRPCSDADGDGDRQVAPGPGRAGPAEAGLPLRQVRTRLSEVQLDLEEAGGFPYIEQLVHLAHVAVGHSSRSRSSGHRARPTSPFFATLWIKSPLTVAADVGVRSACCPRPSGPGRLDVLPAAFLGQIGQHHRSEGSPHS